MFSRIIQATIICSLMTSLVVFANEGTHDNTEAIEVVRETKSVEEVMPEPTYIPNTTPTVTSIEPEEIVSEIEETEYIEEPAEPEIIMSDDDIALIALVTMAEAEGESELGKRLVIDVILNRLDSERHPDTVSGVIYAPGQWSSVWNGRIDECYVMEEICELVKEELISRTNYDVLYFRTKHYHSFGTPLFKEDGHYFSGI